jgi:hypothetical protein
MVFFAALNAGPDQIPPQSVLFLLSASAICISVACISQKSRPVTMRLIGVILVVAGVGVLFFAPAGPNTNPAPKGLKPMVFAFFLALGGGWLAITGKYPSWGAHGRIFQALEEANSQQKPKRKRPVKK